MKKEKEQERKLSKAEEERKKEFEHLKEKMSAEGYSCQDLTIDNLSANIMALIFGIPLILLFGFFFLRRNAERMVSLGMKGMWLLIVLYILFIVVHELIHGITWGIFAKGHSGAISFGVIPKYLMPYCTCKEPLSKRSYILGAVMPTLFLGILPSVIAIYNGSVLLFFLGALLIIGGGGDMTIVWRILQHHSSAGEVIYVDHPYECGVVTFER